MEEAQELSTADSEDKFAAGLATYLQRMSKQDKVLLCAKVDKLLLGSLDQGSAKPISALKDYLQGADVSEHSPATVAAPADMPDQEGGAAMC